MTDGSRPTRSAAEKGEGRERREAGKGGKSGMDRNYGASAVAPSANYHVSDDN
jgi:hypothetical protein